MTLDELKKILDAKGRSVDGARAQQPDFALLERFPAVSFVADLDDGPPRIHVSPQIEDVLGYHPREWLEDPLLWYQRLHPDDHAVLDAALARGGPFRAECRLLDRDGGAVWLHVEASLTRDDQGRPLVVHGMACDVTARKRAEEELRAVHEARARQERMAAIEQLAASVSHDLRNPLGAIGYALFYVKRVVAGSTLAASDPRVGECLAMIERELAVCGNVVGHLLSAARRQPPEVAGWPLRELVDEAAALVRGAGHVTIHNEVPADLTAPRVDHDQLRQALVNLIQNAVEAIPVHRAGTVRIGGSAGPDEVSITVSDDGTGIPGELLQRVSEPLLSTKPHGTGLGLAIVSSLIKAHGGTLQVESQPGQGTVFRIRMPKPPPA